jgi:hypothetical protein
MRGSGVLELMAFLGEEAKAKNYELRIAKLREDEGEGRIANLPPANLPPPNRP